MIEDHWPVNGSAVTATKIVRSRYYSTRGFDRRFIEYANLYITSNNIALIGLHCSINTELYYTS